ncbi:MAG: hypothetical protein Q7R78_01325 [bacterium]|nr:hypothetical protein [bacterium]
MNIKNKIISDRTKGYTLLYAVLLAGVVMIVGVSILMIGKKELMLSEGLTESQRAIYAADSGLECFKALDNTGMFATSTNNIQYTDMLCNNSAARPINNINNPRNNNTGSLKQGNNSPWELKMSNDDPAQEDVYVLGIYVADNITNPDNPNKNPDTLKKLPCFSIRVYKTWNDTSVWPATTITSKGYSTCDPADTRRVERTLEMNY